MQSLDRSALQQRAARYLADDPKPFLRWAGSKRRLLTQLVEYLPPEFGRYYEPFLGGGALFFLMEPKNALLSDANEQLINVWTQIRDSPSGVFKRAHSRPLDERNYYAVRAIRRGTATQRAGDFLYLNRGSFNGLYRVNRSGEFNVPWGRPRTSNIIDLAALNSASDAVRRRGISLAVLDFEVAVNRARPGDLVYLDPPYVTQHNANGFVDYNEKIFSWSDQERLALAAERARKRGAHVLVSNALHNAIKKLYSNFEVHELRRQSSIAGNTSKRGEAKEALFVGRPNG